jgi:hypothetical protein
MVTHPTLSRLLAAERERDARAAARAARASATATADAAVPQERARGSRLPAALRPGRAAFSARRRRWA